MRFLWFSHVLYAYSHVPTSCNATWGLRAQLVLLQLLTPVPRCAIFYSNVSSCLLQSPETVYHLFVLESPLASILLRLQHPEHHGRMKHLDLRFYWLRDQVEAGILVPQFIGTNKMPADVLTKPLSRDRVTRLLKLQKDGTSNG